jgi:hypothetical protein
MHADAIALMTDEEVELLHWALASLEPTLFRDEFRDRWGDLGANTRQQMAEEHQRRFAEKEG